VFNEKGICVLVEWCGSYKTAERIARTYGDIAIQNVE
jgi:hypothetical protein